MDQRTVEVMEARGSIDIAYSDIFVGLYHCLHDSLFATKITKEQSVGKGELICLSVRTGLDLVLQSLDLPAGSEVLVADVNIQDMFSIFTAHHLIPVPIPLNKNTLCIDEEKLKASITLSTRAVLVTHLFGGLVEMDNIISLASLHKLTVIEDCAQGYAGDSYQGHAQTDVVMFSFGFIKTNTAISGAVLKINNTTLYADVVRLNNLLPVQSIKVYLKKMLVALVVKLLTGKLVYSLFFRFIVARGKDPDQVLSGFTRGFPGKGILDKIRFRPSKPIKKMVARKIRNYKMAALWARTKYATDILTAIPAHYRIGFENKLNTYWVLPIASQNPIELIKYLRLNGFDTTAKASSLVHFSAGTELAIAQHDLYLNELVYLPMQPKMGKRNKEKLGALLSTFTAN